ncbi:MAG: type VI secretion system protein TssA [Burkholderiales bacterium]|nr:type VI secretion system protein TssA [Burkholderiales bacterium]
MFTAKQLLRPIDHHNGCGDNLAFSSEMDALSEARRFDDPSLDQGEWVTELKEANWSFVVSYGAELIEHRSKDLRLAVWLTEAATKVYQFAGLAEGFTLISGLCDTYWDHLYPTAEDGDQEQRIGNLHWLLNRTVQLVREIPLTEGKGTAYCATDFDSARTRAANADRIAAEYGRPEEGPKLAELESARRKTSRQFYVTLLEGAQAAREALEKLEQSVDVRLGIDGPGFSGAKDAIDDVIRTIMRFAEDVGVSARGATVESASADQVMEVANTDGGLNSKIVAIDEIAGLRNRQQAIAQLRAVADFFRRTEPHSPVAYLAEKAAVWGEMPFHEWLGAVIKDQGSLQHVEELLGVGAKSGN